VQITVVCVGIPKTSPASSIVKIDGGGPIQLHCLITDHLDASFGPGIATTLLDGDRLSTPYIALVNGKNTAQMAGLETLVDDGAQVVFTVPVAGG
jgi:molybdopterin converting factor small subunit